MSQTVLRPPPAPPSSAPDTLPPTFAVVHRRGPGRARTHAGTLVALALGALLALVAFVGDGGSGVGRMTTVEIVLLLVGGSAVVAAILLSRTSRTPGGWSVAAFAALAALTTASIAWAIDPGAAWLEANRFVAYLAAFAGALAAARLAPRRWPSVIGAILGATSVMCVYAVLTKVAPGWLQENEIYARLREPFGYWNAVGLAGALALPGALWLGSRPAGRPLVNALAAPLIALAVGTALLSYSRGALVAGLVGLALWFVLVPHRLRAAAMLLLGSAGGGAMALWAFDQTALAEDGVPLPAREAAGLELTVLLVGVLLLLYGAALALGFRATAWPLRPASRRRIGIALLVAVALAPVCVAAVLSSTDRGLGGTVRGAWASLTDPQAGSPANDPGRLTAVESVRSRYWHEAWRMFDDEPLHGFGADGYATARPRYQLDLRDAQHAHGYVMQTAADLGALGLIAIAAALVAWLVAVVRTLRHRTGPERAGLATLAVVAVVFGVHSTIDWTWYVPGTAVIGLVAAGWVAGRGPGAPEGAGPLVRRPARLVLAALTALLVAVAGWTAWQPLRAEATANRALDAAEEGRFDDARRLATSARDIDPLSVDPLLALGAVEQQARRPRAAEAALERSTDEHPWSWQAWFRLAELRLRELGDPASALRAVRVATYLNPREFEVTQLFLDTARTLGPERFGRLTRRLERER